MHPDIAALIALQSDDAEIHRMEGRLSAMAPRLDALARAQARAAAMLDKAKQAVADEERRRREVEGRLAQHRTLRERNQQQLDNIHNQREASAASAQLEQTNRMIADDERELGDFDQRLHDLRATVTEREQALAAIELEQQDAHSSMDADAKMIQAQLADLRSAREKKAPAVPRKILQQYDRIRAKHPEQAAFPLRAGACSNCETMIPMQRRAGLNAGNTDICEGCGVLLFAGE